MKKIKKKTNKLTLIILSSVVLAGLVYLGYYLKLFDFSKDNDNTLSGNKVEVEEKKLQILDLESNTRPYAVMINNIGTARPLQSGLQDAYMIYEIIVEGGLTRYMALFKDVDVERIGSVRSARHYYLDYALENDAIYVHWGFSDQAKNDIKTYKVNSLNGLYYEGKYFFRDRSLKVSSEHTGFTTTEMIEKGSDKLKFRTTSDEYLLFDYSVDSLDLNAIEGSKTANKITIEYPKVTNLYEYDTENKLYKHTVNGAAHKDYVTEKQYTFKNIITYQVENTTIKGDYAGRQNLNNIGKGEGFYISEGVAVPITWEKKTRTGKTLYHLKNGDKLKLNDGNTFIHIQPEGKKLVIE